jgi:hypothetical protein
MTAARAKAPTLAWLLTALTCLLVGMAIVESRHQAVALPVWAPAGPGATAEVGGSLGGPSEPTPTLIRAAGEPSATPATPGIRDITVPLSTGTFILKVTRIFVPPGVDLPTEVAAGETVLLVETGTLAVQIDRVVDARQGHDPALNDANVSAQGRLVIAAGTRYDLRNDGPTPVEALAVTIFPLDTLSPLPRSG